MAKRFTDTDIWKSQRWFRKLKPLDKLAFGYIKDQCSHAGLWKIDCSDLMEDLGLDEFDLPKFIDAVNTEFDKITGKKILKERFLIIKNYLWITGFVQYQYENKEGKVSCKAAPVRTAMLILQGLGILAQAISKGYITLTEPLQEGWERAKDKDKDKEGNDKKKKGVKGEEEKKKGDENSADTVKYLVPQMMGVWKKFKPKYPDDPTKDSFALQAIAEFICNQAGMNYYARDGGTVKKLYGMWGMISEYVSTHDFFRNYSLSQIEKHIQSVTQSMKNGSGKNNKNGSGGVNGEQLNKEFADFHSQAR